MEYALAFTPFNRSLNERTTREGRTIMFRRIATMAAVLAVFAAPALSPLTTPEAAQAQGAFVSQATPGVFTPGDSSSVRPMGAQATPTPNQGRLSANAVMNQCDGFFFDGIQTEPIEGGCRINRPGESHTGPVPDGKYAYKGQNNCTFWGTVEGGVISFYFNGDPQTQQRCGSTPGWTPTPTTTTTTPPQETRDGDCPLFGWAATHPNNSDGSCLLDKSVVVTGTVEAGRFALSGNPVQRYEAGQSFSASKASFYKLNPATATPTAIPTQETRDGDCPLFGWAATHPNTSDGSCKLDKPVEVQGTVEAGRYALSGNPVQRYEAGQSFKATQASFYKLSGTPGTQPGACAPRPNVMLNTQRNGSGGLLVTVTAGTNALKPMNQVHSIQFQISGTNTLVNSGTNLRMDATFTSTYPAGTSSAQFTLTRHQAGPATLPIVVTDDCGVWNTLVGGGPNAF